VLRDELWFGGKRFFKEGGALYPDGKLEGELIAPTYEPDAKGRNKVEKKRDTKKRLGRSPDRADAALLAIYEPGSQLEPMPENDNYADDSRWEGFGSAQGFG
jgi:phage terminase large subunit